MRAMLALVEGGGATGGEDHVVGGEGVGEAGQGHVASLVQGMKEGLELGLVRVIGDVAGIERLEREGAPLVPVKAAEAGGIETVVEQAAFAPDQVNAEV